MFARNHIATRRPHAGGDTPRRGAALLFVLVFVVAMAALAMGSIFMASNSTLYAKSYDRERDLKYAAEAALAIGKARVNSDATLLQLKAGQIDTLILGNATIYDASNAALPGISVNIWIGPTGSTSGQFGRFSSIVAQATDSRNNSYIRRLELTQESFAKFAYWSNSETNSGTPIYFNNGDELWGPVWTNDTIRIGAGGATFHDDVGTAAIVSGKTYGTFIKGVFENQKKINLPSTAVLNNLQTIAGPYAFTSQSVASKTETSVLDRVEFIAFDLNKNGDSLQSNEGFFRVYSAKAGNQKFLRGDWPGTPTTAPAISAVTLCGDFHWASRDSVAPGDNLSHLKFYPASVHSAAWFQADLKQGYTDHYGWPAQRATDSATAESKLTLKQVLDNPGSRCYLAGDPHLVAVDRVTTNVDPLTNLNYTLASIQKGGTDTTFTPNGFYGSWKQYTAAANADTSYRPLRPWDGKYLFPIDRMFNSAARGVIYASGNLGVSGVVNGRVTLYGHGSIILLDDLRYANDPVRGVCADILGLISDNDIVIADNAINSPPPVDPASATAKYYSLDDTKDMYIHAIMMALNTSFRVENYNTGPTAVNDCQTASGLVVNGRGCIYLSGGIIQQARGAVGTSTGSGYTKRYSYDRCAVVNPPPYFPTTGRFTDNRYLELDPVGFDHTAYFLSLKPSP